MDIFNELTVTDKPPKKDDVSTNSIIIKVLILKLK